MSLLIDPVNRVACPVQDFALFEPKANLALGVLNGVASVADVSADFDAEVSADGSRGRFKWVGGSKHFSAGGDGFLALKINTTKN